MPGRIVIFEPDLQNRISLKATLSQEFFEVTTVEAAADLSPAISGQRPDALILSLDGMRARGFSGLQELRVQLSGAYVPILLMHRPGEEKVWADADAAFADEALSYDAPRWLLAQRLNQLIRAAEKVEAMRTRRRTFEDLGFGEMDEVFPPTTARALSIDFTRSGLSDQKQAETLQTLGQHFPKVLGADAPDQTADVTIISDVLMGEVEANRAIAQHCATRDRRSGGNSVSGAVLLVARDMRRRRLQRALELGVDDVVASGSQADEIAGRLRKLGWQRQFTKQADESLSQQLLAAHRDPLTGLYNRRYVMQYIRRLSQRGAGHNGVTVMMLDLDNFKRVNDRFGHGAGDTVLRKTAERLCKSLRASDLVARMGGEEFLIVLADTPAERASVIAQRLCREISGEPFAISADFSIPVSASIGVSQAPPGDRPLRMEALIEAADRALYSAKDAGRNRVSFATDMAA